MPRGDGELRHHPSLPRYPDRDRDALPTADGRAYKI